MLGESEKHVLRVFTLPTCPKCPAAKEVAREVAQELGLDFEELDISDPENLLTALQCQTTSTPSIAIDDELLFRGEVPTKEELKRAIERYLRGEEALAV